VSLVGIVISAGITGVTLASVINNGDFHIGWSNLTSGGWEVSETFEDSYSNIEIDVISARTSIRISPDGITRLNYRNGGNRISFTWEISGNTLIIREQIIWSLYWDSGRASTLDIEIPEAAYNQIRLNLVSGRINGELPETDRFELSVTSGNLSINNLSGSGEVSVMSGTVNLDFNEWNGSLKAEIISGSLNVKVPPGSGADIDYSRVSGSLRYDLDGDSGRMDRSGSASVGGGNKQRVNVDIISGSAAIRNN
jgi:hypothetical protein